MTDPKNEMVHVGNIPEHLRALMTSGDNKYADVNANLQKHRILSRLVLVESMSKELKKQFKEGDIVIPNTMTCVIPKGESVNFVPVMFYDEYISWWDRKDVGQESAIKDRSFSDTSEIARKSMDHNLREEAYGDKDYKIKHSHHLNFLVKLTSGNHADTLCVLSFSRGRFKDGKQLIGAIQMRKVPTPEGPVGVPMFMTQWTLSAGDRTNKTNDEYFSYDIEPAAEPWVGDTALVDRFHELNAELTKEYRDNVLRVDHETGMDRGDATDVTDNDVAGSM